MATFPDDRPIDTSVLPKRIREASAAADRRIAEIGGKAPAEAHTVQEPVPAPQPVPQERQQEPPARQEPVQPPAADAPPEGTETADQKYRSLQGQFERLQRTNQSIQSENAELRRANRATEEQNASLTQRIEALEAGVAPRVNGNSERKFDINTVITDKEREDWGPDFVDLLDRVTNAAVSPHIQEIERLRGDTKKITESAAMSEHEKMRAKLAEVVPDYNAINEDPNFVTWLQKLDEGSGQRRQTLLQDAWGKNNTDRVVYFFTRFLKEEGEAAPEAPREQAGGSGRAPAPSSDPLAKLAAPGKGRQAAPPALDPSEAGPVTIPLSEYTKFLHDKARGKLRMTPEQVKAREAELDAAYNEGRIVAG